MCVSLTGELDFLQKPAVAFARLSDSVVMESVLESSIPVRFIFLLVGPGHSGINYSESGRAMGALLADWVSKKRKHASVEIAQFNQNKGQLICLVSGE